MLEAIERTRPALDAAGVAVGVIKTLVANQAQAQQLGFVSSPTIYINGVDIAGELVESACDTCGETCEPEHKAACCGTGIALLSCGCHAEPRRS